MKKILIYYHSTLWIWHSKRIFNIANRLVKNKNIQVFILMSWLDHRFLFDWVQNINVLYLPQVEIIDFKIINDIENNKKLKLRKIMILKLFEKYKFDMLIVEYFPFWKKVIKQEIMILMKFYKHFWWKKIVCSIRDIFEFEKIMLDWLKYFDKILIHWDRNLYNYDRQFKKIWYKNYEYTWYLIENKKIDKLKQEDFIVVNIWFWVVFDFFENVISFLKIYKKIDKNENNKIIICLWKIFDIKLVNRLKDIYENIECYELLDDFIKIKKKARLNVIMWGYNNILENVLYNIKSIVYIKSSNFDWSDEQQIRLQIFEKNTNFIKDWNNISQLWLKKLMNLKNLKKTKMNFDWIENTNRIVIQNL